MEQHRSDVHAVVLFLLRQHHGVTETLLGLGKPDKRVGAHQWNAPGGRMHENESIASACIREIEEETGVVVSEADIEMQGSELVCTVDGFDTATYLHMAIARMWHGDPSLVSDEFTELAWFPVTALPFSQMIAGDKYWVHRFLSGEYVAGSICHTDKASTAVHRHDISFSPVPFQKL